MIFGNQGIAILACILYNRTGRPLATATDGLIGPLQGHFARKLIYRRVLGVGILHGVHHGLANKQGAVFRIPGPPLHQCLIVGNRMSYMPINLRNIIVYPTFTGPQQHVRIKVIVVLQAFGLTAKRVTAFIPVNAKRRNPELHPRLDFTNCFMQFLNQHIHVAPAPVSFIAETSAKTCKTCIVREILSLNGIRIKVIVHMNGIHIIAGNDVAHHHADVPAALRQCRVKIQLVAISDKPFRMDIVHMIGSQLTLQGRLRAIRINPCMKLHTTLMAFINHKLHRVPIGFGRFTLHSGKETTPRFQSGSIQSIRFGTYLENYGVDSRLLQGIQLPDQILLQFFGRHSTELSVY